MKPASPSCSPAATSAANSVYGYETTLPVTVDELIPLVRAVAGSALHALVADLRFGSYQESPEQC